MCVIESLTFLVVKEKKKKKLSKHLMILCCAYVTVDNLEMLAYN